MDPGWSNSSSTVVTSESHLVTTALRSNPIYIKVYINTMYLIVMYAVPFLILAVLNYRIGVEIQRAKENRSADTFRLLSKIFFEIIVLIESPST